MSFFPGEGREGGKGGKRGEEEEEEETKNQPIFLRANERQDTLFRM